MNPTFQSLPDQASTTARQRDHPSIYLVTVAIIFSTLIFLLILLPAIKYRRMRRSTTRTGDISEKVAVHAERDDLVDHLPSDSCWSCSVWGAKVSSFEMSRPPDDAS